MESIQTDMVEGDLFVKAHVRYLESIQAECSRIAMTTPEEKTKLSETLRVVNDFVKNEKDVYEPGKLLNEAAKYVNDSRPAFKRLGYSMACLALLSVAGLVATAVLSGGITLIPIVIAAGLLGSTAASGGLAAYSFFSARMPTVYRLLVGMAEETKAIHTKTI